jgi:hypothetical protein
MTRQMVVAFVLCGLLAASSWAETAGGKAAAAVPPGAAALGYTKCVINGRPTAADIAPGRNGDDKWFSGQWYSKTNPSLDR